MDEQVTVAPSPPARPAKKLLTKEERKQIAAVAAKKRWAKQKKAAKAGVKKTAKGKSAKTVKGKKSPREFSSALKTAEKQLAKAMHDRDFHATGYAVAISQIPSLMAIIRAFKNPAAPDYGYTAPLPPSLEQIVAGDPINYVNPPRQVAQVPVPQELHPANTQTRAQGGAVGVQLDEEEDEDVHLRASGVAGGQWR